MPKDLSFRVDNVIAERLNELAAYKGTTVANVLREIVSRELFARAAPSSHDQPEETKQFGEWLVEMHTISTPFILQRQHGQCLICGKDLPIGTTACYVDAHTVERPDGRTVRLLICLDHL